MSTIQKKIDQISDIFMKISSDRKTLKSFLGDILSPGEVEDIHNRLMIIESLIQNKTQREVSKDLNVSISKVTRGSNVIKYGSGIFPKLFKAKK
jgi:Trp operon repressor